MNFEVNEECKLILHNNHVYKGRILGKKDKFIDFFDYKFQDAISINEDAIFIKLPLKKDGDLREFSSN